MADNQQATIAFLGDPETYGPDAGEIERHETHISLVFLAGGCAYKLKRAVKLPYLDFSTVERRRAACAAELSLNRRTAPQLYLELRKITRRRDGRLQWGGSGQAIDWVVVMRRFEQDRRLDAVADRGELEPRLLFALAAHIADFHAKAERLTASGGATAIADIVRENAACLSRRGNAPFSDRRIAELRERSAEHLARLTPLLDRRRAEGKVRRCHGDLHLRNVCVLDGQPVLFDCLEFAEELATIDILYDLAFLLMDLDHRGHSDAANTVFNRYLDLTGEDDGLAAMPLFLSLRAAIRAHVTITALEATRGGEGQEAAEAVDYLDEACDALAPRPARLIAIGGVSGSGKSTLAATLAADLGARPGARLCRSDVIRKRLFGLEPEAKLPAAAYTPEVNSRVYERLCAQAGTALRAGYCVIIDAVALREEERQSFAEIARQARVPFSGLWLEAPAETLLARVAARRHDASDATPEIVERQLSLDPGPLDWMVLAAGRDFEATVAGARRILQLTRTG